MSAVHQAGGLSLGDAYGWVYQVQVSDDALHWTDIYSTVPAMGPWITWTYPPWGDRMRIMERFGIDRSSFMASGPRNHSPVTIIVEAFRWKMRAACRSGTPPSAIAKKAYGTLRSTTGK